MLKRIGLIAVLLAICASLASAQSGGIQFNGPNTITDANGYVYYRMPKGYIIRDGTQPTCTAAIAGMLWYNSSTGAHEACVLQNAAYAWTSIYLRNNGDGTYSAPGSAPIKSQAGAGSGTTLPSGVLCRVLTTVATSGTSEEILGTCTIPANTLSADGMALRFTGQGNCAANGNSKTLRVRIGGLAGTQILGNALAINNQGWRVTGEVIRTGAATQKAGGKILMGTSPFSLTTVSPTIDLSAETTLVITGHTATAAGDLTMTYFFVELVR